MSHHIHADSAPAKERISKQCAALSDVITAHRDELRDLLLNDESYETAKDELWRSLDALQNISKEIDYLSYGRVDLMCTFLPVNLPLYSLVIFVIVPGFMANEVIVRPPVLMRDLVQKIWTLLQLTALFPHIKFVDM